MGETQVELAVHAGAVLGILVPAHRADPVFGNAELPPGVEFPGAEERRAVAWRGVFDPFAGAARGVGGVDRRAIDAQLGVLQGEPGVEARAPGGGHFQPADVGLAGVVEITGVGEFCAIDESA